VKDAAQFWLLVTRFGDAIHVSLRTKMMHGFSGRSHLQVRSRMFHVTHPAPLLENYSRPHVKQLDNLTKVPVPPCIPSFKFVNSRGPTGRPHQKLNSRRSLSQVDRHRHPWLRGLRQLCVALIAISYPSAKLITGETLTSNGADSDLICLAKWDESTNNGFLSPDAASFAEATTLNVPTARLFPHSWSPHLDVFVVATRIAERNHLVLHAMREGAVWDVEFDGPAPHPDITSVCWSPDGE